MFLFRSNVRHRLGTKVVTSFKLQNTLIGRGHKYYVGLRLKFFFRGRGQIPVYTVNRVPIIYTVLIPHMSRRGLTIDRYIICQQYVVKIREGLNLVSFSSKQSICHVAFHSFMHSVESILDFELICHLHPGTKCLHT